jgi:transposase
VPNLRTETDIQVVRQVAVLQEQHIHLLTKKLAEAHAKLAELTGQNDLQADLALVEALAKAGAEPTGTPPTDKSKDPPKDEPQRGHGATEQPGLVQEELVCSLPETEQTCSKCGEKLKRAPGLDERSELIDVVEVRYVLRKVTREAAVCRCGECVVVALGPERVTAGGRYSLDFGIKVALDKYLDHLPLARQTRIMSRHGLEVSDQTLWDQLRCLGEELIPTWKAVRSHILEGPVIGVDQTPWPNLEENAPKPWQMWSLTRDGAVWHGIQEDKSLETFEKLLGGYQGVVVADMMSTHLAGAQKVRGLVLAACWAHVLRKFRDAAENHPEANFALECIGRLYAIDAEATSLEHRLELRQTRSIATLAELREWLLAQRTVKATTLGAAVNYTLKSWHHLQRFTTDARIWLDNNPTERALRGPVVGRRNHFGSKSKAGTQVAAVFYTLVETAKVRGINPAEYLRAAIQAARAGRLLIPGT